MAHNVAMRLLVTGFKPWGDHGANPSELAASLAARFGFSAEVFPVSYEVVGQAFEGENFDRILLFGLASSRSEITLERFAYNETKPELLDVEGKPPRAGLVLPDGEAQIESKLDLERLCTLLRHEWIPSHISTDPGRYLCNFAYYRALAATKGEALFVHLPPLSEGFDENRLKHAVAVLLQAMH